MDIREKDTRMKAYGEILMAVEAADTAAIIEAASDSKYYKEEMERAATSAVNAFRDMIANDIKTTILRMAANYRTPADIKADTPAEAAANLPTDEPEDVPFF